MIRKNWKEEYNIESHLFEITRQDGEYYNNNPSM